MAGSAPRRCLQLRRVAGDRDPGVAGPRRAHGPGHAHLSRARSGARALRRHRSRRRHPDLRRRGHRRLRRRRGRGTLRDFLAGSTPACTRCGPGRAGLRDVAVARVLADEFAFVRTVVRVEVVIRATGYDSRRIPVTLSSEGQVLRQKWVDIGPGDSEVPVIFEVTPPRVGKLRLRDRHARRRGRGSGREQPARVRAARHPRQDPRAAGGRAAVVGRARAAPDARGEPERRSDLVLHPAHAGRLSAPCPTTRCR